MIDRKHCFGLFLSSLLLSGCVPFPRFVEEPYEDDISSLKTGFTNKEDVLVMLGEPGATYRNESVFVYTNFQEQVTLIGAVGAGLTFGESYYLTLSFGDDDVLSDYSVEASTPDSHGCISTGWCADIQNRVLRLAHAEQDAKAKQFLASESHCRIYVYGPIPSAYAVSVDGVDFGGIFGDRYFQTLYADPGAHDIALTLQPGIKGNWFSKNLPTLSLDCVAGELNFVHLKRGWTKAIFELVEQSEGRKQVASRRLVISGPMRKISNP